jgi:predicted amidohydrolase YtcJ
VVGDRIAWVGDSGEALRAWRGPRTEVLDARGGLVSAGFDDAHIHLLEGARQMDDIDLSDAASPAEIGAAIRAGAAERSGKPWVVGRGWKYGSFPAGLPTARQVDLLVPDRPALMGAYDGHTTWVNSRGLSAAGIGTAPRIPPTESSSAIAPPASRPACCSREPASSSSASCRS